MNAVARWAFPLVSPRRADLLHRAVAVVAIIDVLFLTTQAAGHGNVPRDLYDPLPVRDLLRLPMPTHGYVVGLRIAIIVAAILVALGRFRRIAGWVLAIGMLDWVSNAYSYSKVNHDHFAMMVALFVLPLAIRPRDNTRAQEQAAGWSVRMVQIAVVATYFLAAVAKMIEAGPGWASSAVLVWAITRRGSALGDIVAAHPVLTYAMQWIVLAMEFLSPLMLWLRGRLLYAYVAFWVCFHISTFLLLGIHFLPTVVCLLAFLPIERLSLRRPG